MSHDEHHQENLARHERRRWAKKLLRFMPRRTQFHKYPLVGRFAHLARKRAYLWSFKTVHMRPAFYAGSIISLLPLMGVQLPVVFAFCLVLRANFMVAGGLQFITNPFTAVPIYYATHRLGAEIIEFTGFGHSLDVVEDEATLAGEKVTPHLDQIHAQPGTENEPRRLKWTRKLGAGLNALVIGGIVSGVVLAVVLDVIWRFTGGKRHHRPHGRHQHHPPSHHHHQQHRSRSKRSRSTGGEPPPT